MAMPAMCSGSIKERFSASSTGSASRGICKPLSIAAIDKTRQVS